MSLIHEALKKADKKNASLKPTISPVMPYDEKKSQLNTRTIFLIVLLIGASIFAVYMNFFSGPSKPKPAPVKDIAGNATKASMDNAEVAHLKKTAEQYYANGEYDQAWAMFSAIRDVQPNDPEVLNNLGMVAKDRGDLNEASQLFEQASSINPACVECLNNAASVDMERGDTQSAKKRLLHVLDLNPSYPEANFHLALISEQEGNTQHAAKYYMTFVKNAKHVSPQFLEEVRTHIIEIQE